jgi:hypothetical protein
MHAPEEAVDVRTAMDSRECRSQASSSSRRRWFFGLLALLLASSAQAIGYLTFTVVAQSPGDMKVEQATREVIGNRAAWERFFRAATRDRTPVPPVPYVDFDAHRILLVGSGTQRSGGYAIAVHGVFEEDTQILVQVLELRPGSGCGTTEALTYPTRVVLVPRSEKPFRFRTTHASFDCN